MRYQNNPGNIRYNPDIRGVIGNDNGFSKFDSLANGIRAIWVVLNTYANSYGLKTIRQILTRYAPATENNLAVYITNVSTWTGINPDVPLSGSDYLKVIAAICRQETGSRFSLSEIQSAIDGKLFSGTSLILAGLVGIFAMWKLMQVK